MKYLLWVILFTLINGCNQDTLKKDLSIATLKKGVINLESFKKNKLNVLFFISPDCPLSKEYALSIKELKNKNFKSNDLKIFLVVCGNYYSKMEIEDYIYRYKIDLDVLLDEKNELKNYLDATVTPEVFVIQNNLNIIYHGAIDNKYISVKDKRDSANEFYLMEAIKNGLENKVPEIRFVKPIGCFIE